MSTAQKSLNDFLNRHCEIKSVPTGAGGAKERCYIYNTEDCLLFMAETHVQEMRNAVDQTDDVLTAAKNSGDYSGIIMAYNWNAPEPGMDSIRIPVKLIESLDDKRAMIILRNLQGIQKDIDEGNARKEGLLLLFRDTATIKTSTNLDGERIFVITGKKSTADRRLYAERYAEQVAIKILFNLPKALNARVQELVPKEAKGRFFVEGRDLTARKIRPTKDAHTELVLNDDGALVYTEIAKKNPRVAEAIGKLFRQAIMDPFGLALKYYMGKHAIIKIPSKEDK